LPPVCVEEINQRLQTLKHSFFLRAFVERLPDIPELRAHKQPNGGYPGLARRN